LQRVVITGGPGSGKTTLVEAVGARGFATVPEAAIEVIAELNAELGLEEQKAWRRAHVDEFQRLVLERQLAQEAEARDGTAVFLDRGVVDGLGYCRHFGTEPPPELLAASAEDRYDRVFLLDTLPEVIVRGDTGRTSDRAASLAIAERIAEVYRERGLEPVRVPVASVEERVGLVLGALGLD
jgi:predicted ATPase